MAMTSIEYMLTRLLCNKLSSLPESQLVPWWIARRLEDEPSRVPVYQINIEKESWELDLRYPSQLSISKKSTPPCFINMSLVDLERLHQESKSVRELFEESKIEIDYNITLAVHLFNLLEDKKV